MDFHSAHTLRERRWSSSPTHAQQLSLSLGPNTHSYSLVAFGVTRTLVATQSSCTSPHASQYTKLSLILIHAYLSTSFRPRTRFYIYRLPLTINARLSHDVPFPRAHACMYDPAAVKKLSLKMPASARLGLGKCPKGRAEKIRSVAGRRRRPPSRPPRPRSPLPSSSSGRCRPALRPSL